MLDRWNVMEKNTALTQNPLFLLPKRAYLTVKNISPWTVNYLKQMMKWKSLWRMSWESFTIEATSPIHQWLLPLHLITVASVRWAFATPPWSI